MYKIRRKQTIEESLVIEDSKGETVLELPVKLHVDDILVSYNRLRSMLGEAQRHLQREPESEECMTAYGAAVLALLELVFGKEGSAKLLEYYENRYMELLEDVAPFIIDRIQPQMEAAMRERAEKLQRMAGKASK